MFWMWFFAILSFVLALYMRRKYEGITASAYVRGDDIEKLPKGKNRIYELIRPIMPGKTSLEWIGDKIVQAKLKNTPEQVWVLSYVLFALLAAMALYLGISLFKDRSVVILFSVVSGFIGISLPLLYVYLEAQKADQARTREMLPFIQQLKVLAKSGLGTTFGALAAITIEDSRGMLAEDLREMTNEVSQGKSRREAIVGMVERSNSKLLREVMELILDAEDKELPLYNVLEGVESRLLNDIEVKADEAMAKAEDKMAIPLAAMLLPANMLIMIGPGVISARSLLNF